MSACLWGEGCFVGGLIPVILICAGEAPLPRHCSCSPQAKWPFSLLTSRDRLLPTHCIPSSSSAKLSPCLAVSPPRAHCTDTQQQPTLPPPGPAPPQLAANQSTGEKTTAHMQFLKEPLFSEQVPRGLACSQICLHPVRSLACQPSQAQGQEAAESPSSLFSCCKWVRPAYWLPQVVRGCSCCLPACLPASAKVNEKRLHPRGPWDEKRNATPPSLRPSQWVPAWVGPAWLHPLLLGTRVGMCPERPGEATSQPGPQVSSQQRGRERTPQTHLKQPPK